MHPPYTAAEAPLDILSERVNFLCRHPVLTNCPLAELESVAPFVEERVTQPGSAVVKQGDEVKQCALDPSLKAPPGFKL